MYTRCPHCTTIFQVTAEQLRLAHGDVSCVTCTESFSALESLSDDVTALIATPATTDPGSPDEESEAILDGADTVVDPDRDTDTDQDLADDEETAREETLDAADIDADIDDRGDDETGSEDSEDDDAEPDEDESAREETPDDSDSEDDTGYDTRDQSDSEPEDADIDDRGDDGTGPEDSEDHDAKPDEDESAREEPAEEDDSEGDSEDDTLNQPLTDRSDLESEDADDRDDETWPEDSEVDEAVPEDGESAREEPPDHGDNESDSDDDTPDQPRPDRSDLESEDADGSTEEPTPAESMEFNAPEQTWTKYFLTDDDNVSPDRGASESADQTEPEPWISNEDPDALENQTGNQSEWQMFLAELNDDLSAKTTETGHPQTAEAIDPFDDGETGPEEPFGGEDNDAETTDDVDPSVIPPWLADERPDETQQQGRRLLPSWRSLAAFAALALLLAGQLIHYNRDALAAHASYGAVVRNAYDLLGASLYPDWPLDAFEVTGTEAIAGRSNQDALDVLANVIVTGRQPVGLPLIRIVLRDRWTNPVASRVFEPSEYLRLYDPANPLVRPGTALPVEVSVADPGTEAMGYIVDVCLPRRKTGLECQIARDPFQ